MKQKEFYFFDIYLKQGIEMDGFFLIQNDQATNKKNQTNDSQLKRMKSFSFQLFSFYSI